MSFRITKEPAAQRDTTALACLPIDEVLVEQECAGIPLGIPVLIA